MINGFALNRKKYARLLLIRCAKVINLFFTLSFDKANRFYLKNHAHTSNEI